MKILLVLWHPLYVLRLYDSTIRALAERGHQLHLGFTNMDATSLMTAAGPYLQELTAKYPQISYSLLPCRDDSWAPLAQQIRGLRTYLHYLRPYFQRAPRLLERAGEEVSASFQVIRHVPFIRGRFLQGMLARLLRWCEQAIPSDPATEQAILAHQPDLVLVTPLVHAPAKQHDYVKSGRSLGLPTAIGVASWDNLTTKGLIQHEPDRIFLWNEAQRQEATRLHDMPEDKVVMTGAQAYDHWFTQSPSTTREQFCTRLGLNPANRILLYLCSSRFLQENETAFIERWLRHLRASDHPMLKEIGVLIRPYPTSTAQQWSGVDFSRYGPVAIWPRSGEHPLLDAAKTTYFDSLYHSAAVVGVNTSGLLEAGIVGRRCFTVLAPDFADKQAGTVHFDYLLRSGFLVSAQTFEEHFAQLAREMEAPNHEDAEVRAFLKTFLRPLGLESPATQHLVDAIEKMGKMRTSPVRTPPWLLPLRWLLSLPAWAFHRRAISQPQPDAGEKPRAKKAA